METVVTQRKWQLADLKSSTLNPKVWPPVIVQLLAARGITTTEAAQAFFEPNYDRDIHDPFLFKNMRAAVGRIFAALEAGEHITIHGDYDADGVTGSALIMTVLRTIAVAMNKNGVHVDSYIPHREREGYGLSLTTVDFLHKHGTNLIITVDCGIACREPIARASELGMDTIVVDHHDFPAELPEAILIHPRLPGETYPFPYLAAVGVAWKLATAIIIRARELGFVVSDSAEKWLLDLVAVATVTDMVPLVGENRALEFFGLKVLQKTKRLGFQKLFERADIEKEKIDTTTIGFQIGPRINAAGRMEHAEAALALLISTDAVEAERLATKLHDQNTLRQQESNRMFLAAREQLAARRATRLLWAIGDGWSPGLVGLVAGKLVQEFARPVLVMGRLEDRIVGSGRSVPGFHITEALRAGAEYLSHFGGHPQACGFTVLPDKCDLFLAHMEASAEEQLAGLDLVPTLSIAAELSLEDLTLAFAEKLEQFAPYGEGNPVPRFLSSNLTVVQSDLMGDAGKHLRLIIRSPKGTTQKCIGFGFGGVQTSLFAGQKIDLVYEISINEWQGRREVQSKIIDWRASSL